MIQYLTFVGCTEKRNVFTISFMNKQFPLPRITGSSALKAGLENYIVHCTLFYCVVPQLTITHPTFIKDSHVHAGSMQSQDRKFRRLKISSTKLADKKGKRVYMCMYTALC